jgi:lysophospholipase L1-like esterase
LHIFRSGTVGVTLACALTAALGPGLGCRASNRKPAVDSGVDAERPALIAHPNPIISRGKPDVPVQAALVNNDRYHDGGWSTPVAALPASVAINLGAGPTRLLVQWDDGGTYNYKTPPSSTVYGLPLAYTIDVSGDSSDGTDGTWTSVVTVTDNAVRSRGHAIDFTGKSWLRMSITAAPTNISGNGVQIGEIDVHDISATGTGLPDDTWFFMGDSLTALAYDRAAAHQPSFAAGINAALPDYFPAMLNGGIGSETSAMGLARLPEALALNPDYRFFVLGYGTNDVNHGTVASFRTNMQAMIDMVKGAGRLPIIPRIPYAGNAAYANVPAYNSVVDELVASNQLNAGPDLFAYFMGHPEEFTCPPCGSGRLTDNLHPNDVGLAAMNQLWTEAARPLYP